MSLCSLEKTIQDITYQIERGNKFSFLSIPNFAIKLTTEENPTHNNKAISSSFIRSLDTAIHHQDRQYLRGFYPYGNPIFKSLNNQNTYRGDVFETYIKKDLDTLRLFGDYYIRYSKYISVSFGDDLVFNNYFGKPVKHITVPFNTYYDKLDDVYSQISEFDEDLDFVLFDSPCFSIPMAYKIWKNLSISTIDFGKGIVSLKYLENKPLAKSSK